MKSVVKAAALLCLGLLQACGGGGGGGGPPPAQAASITQQPVGATAADGTSLWLSVVAVHATSVRWQRSDDGGSTWSDIAGANDTNLPLVANYATRSEEYRAVVSGAGGDDTSTAVTLDVTPVAPRIQGGPYSQTILAGNSVTFNVSVAGSVPSVRWQTSRDGTTWTDVAGGTDTSLTLDQPDSTASGTQYRVVVTNPAGETTSPMAMLVIVPNTFTPVFVTGPVSVTVPVGGTARFDARTMAAAQGETMQWQVSSDHGATWTDLPGPQFSSLTLASVSAADDGKQFRREAINAHDHVNSTVATLTVGAPRGHLDLLAGRIGGSGHVDAAGADARMSATGWPSVDTAGNVYFGSFAQLRKVDPSGRVGPFAGDAMSQLGGTFVDAASGSGGDVNMGMVTGTAVAPDGTVYSADAIFNTIRRTRPDGSSSVFAGTPDSAGGSADGTGVAARFLHPQGIALDASGNLFVADTDNHTIRKITPDGVVTTLAGKAGVAGSSGTTTNDALFRRPLGVAVDARGVVYVTDSGNATVRTITPVGNVTVLAGSPGLQGFDDGLGATARFGYPMGIAVDSGATVYVGDEGRIRTVTGDGRVQTLADVSGTGKAGVFAWNEGIALAPGGGLVVADGATLQKVAADGSVSLIAGAHDHSGSVDGTGASAAFQAAGGIAADAAGNVYVTDRLNGGVRKVTPAGVVTTLASGLLYAQALAVDAGGNIIVGGQCTVWRIAPGGTVTILAGRADACGQTDGNGGAARLESVVGIAVDAAGNIAVVDSAGLHTISPSGDVRLLLASSGMDVDGPAGTARLGGAESVAFDAAGNLLVGSAGAVRRITPAGTASTLAGSGYMGNVDGSGAAARIGWTNALSLDAAGNVYTCDQYSTVRRIAPDGTVTTVLGTSDAFGVVLGANPLVNAPTGIAVIDAGHLAVMSENALLVYTLP